MAFDREAIKQRAAELATKGVWIGTSSWKYEGWFGQLYTPRHGTGSRWIQQAVGFWCGAGLQPMLTTLLVFDCER
jgi:hypothetical protein